MSVMMQLTDLELEMAETVALWFMRRVVNDKLGAGHGDATRTHKKRLEDTAKGNIAEMAFAKERNVYWSGNRDEFGKSRKGEVDGFEVRGTTFDGPDSCCNIYESDHKLPVMLVIVTRFDGGAHCEIIGTVDDPEAAKTLENAELAAKYLKRPVGKLWWVHRSKLTPYHGKPR